MLNFFFHSALHFYDLCVPPSGYKEGCSLCNILALLSLGHVHILYSMVYLQGSYRWKFEGWLVSCKGGLGISLEICQCSTERLWKSARSQMFPMPSCSTTWWTCSSLSHLIRTWTKSNNWDAHTGSGHCVIQTQIQIIHSARECLFCLL